MDLGLSAITTDTRATDGNLKTELVPIENSQYWKLSIPGIPIHITFEKINDNVFKKQIRSINKENTQDESSKVENGESFKKRIKNIIHNNPDSITYHLDEWKKKLISESIENISRVFKNRITKFFNHNRLELPGSGFGEVQLDKNNLIFTCSYNKQKTNPIIHKIDQSNELKESNVEDYADFLCMRVSRETQLSNQTFDQLISDTYGNREKINLWDGLKKASSQFLKGTECFDLYNHFRSLMFFNDDRIMIGFGVNLKPVAKGTFSKLYIGTNLNESNSIYACLIRAKDNSQFDNLKTIDQSLKALKAYPENIINYNSFYEITNLKCIFTEYCLGGDLNNNRDDYDCQTRVGFVVDLYRGMSQLFQAGYGHFDIKPDNHLVTFNNGKLIAKLSDLEFCGKLDAEGNSLEDVERFTPEYAAPELLLKEKTCSLKTDLYSAAMTASSIILKHTILRDADNKRTKLFANDSNLTVEKYKKYLFDVRFDGDKIPLSIIFSNVLNQDPKTLNERSLLYFDTVKFIIAGTSFDPNQRPSIEACITYYEMLSKNSLTLFF